MSMKPNDQQPATEDYAGQHSFLCCTLPSAENVFLLHLLSHGRASLCHLTNGIQEEWGAGAAAGDGRQAATPSL